MKNKLIYTLVAIFAILALAVTGCQSPTYSPSGTTSPSEQSPAAGNTLVPPASTTPAEIDQNNNSNDDNNNNNSTGTKTPTAVASVTPPMPPSLPSVSGNGDSSSDNASETGYLEVQVTDAPADDTITEIMVTVDSIAVHKAEAEQEQESESDDEDVDEDENTNENENENADEDDGWITIELDEENPSFDLLKVKEDPETLAFIPFETGTYTQVRIVVSSVEITFDNGEEEYTETASIPSGTIKLVHSFEVTEDDSTVLLLDFDAAQSVNITGNGSVNFKPVIKITSDKEEKKAAHNADLEITTDELADGQVDLEYSAGLNAKGGQSPYTWEITDGDLPDGLDLDEDTGEISGTPEDDDEYTFTVKVTDSSADPQTDELEFTITIEEEGALQISTTALPSGKINTEYAEFTLEAVGGNGDYTWSLTDGALPAGLELTEDGVIKGTPTESGNFSITITVTDSAGDDDEQTAEQTFPLRINKSNKK